MANLPSRVIEVADDFWNIRGTFRIGPLDIGTHASLVRRQGGKFVLLDAVELDQQTRAWIAELTDGGRDLEAILHVHPFHTVFVEGAHRQFPDARLYGTARHHRLQPELPWQELRTEAQPLHELFADDLEFSVPRGVDFISPDPKLHFSSVLVFHPASKTLHVDDTVIYAPMPLGVRLLKRDITRFHPTLAKVLEPGPEAADEFHAWACELIERCESIDNLCAAHTGALLGRDNRGASVADRLRVALAKVERVLSAHRNRS
ncbi:MAG: DUF4336 domain-containing protein [Deltaproteobacteria bacterium]|nr:DUF4336 domain-containing protein [Deltaproteobacteria bacterium]